ncbi:MAG: PTS system mannose/fructose/sorbose family transporter subunit IID [Gemmatimonadota bacterium]|nr:PTS system mannose/fructose/sorbose family transporter subunit IID [Gemmatimonadota bacterium]
MTRGPDRPDRGERRRVALRSTLLQALWNYETLQGPGFGWSLLPGLRRLYPDRERRAERLSAHMEVFNSNPYLSTLGLGVALRMETEVARGAAGADRRLARLLKALRGTLGALGDELFWAGWRPALGIVAALGAIGGFGAWAAVAFVGVFNALAQSVRAWGVDAGFAAGAGVARVLQSDLWSRGTRAARLVGAIGAGAALGAGLVWASDLGGGVRGLGVFSLAIVLLWLAGLRVGSRGRPVSPSLAFLSVLILLSALLRVLEGATG